MPEGGFTVDEWLVYWSWQYFISTIDVETYIEQIDYIELEMPGALEHERWEAHADYLKLLSRNSR